MKEVVVKVWGDYACFTRPEMKVERVSYDVMTPSAARGILEAILWKPAIRWQVRRIAVLKPIRWIQFRRNELGKKIPVINVITEMKKGKGNLGMFIEGDRQQRAGLFLRDVAYLIYATLMLTDKANPSDNLAKFQEMFLRRVEKGQCYVQPVLGCREFSAYFGPPSEDDNPIPEDKDFGWMLYDLDFRDVNDIRPIFFDAKMRKGIVEIPEL